MRKLLDIVWMKHLPRPWSFVGRGLLGSFFGLFFVVAYVSNAASYLSDEPEACINCHIMNPEYVTWRHSSHARVANCNDCHVPHDSTWRKYFFKANDGLRHSALFTLRMERQVIEAIPESKEVIQQNCVRCHSATMARAGAPGHASEERTCIDCHREVPHGRVHSLSSTPNAALPPLKPVIPEWLLKETKK